MRIPFIGGENPDDKRAREADERARKTQNENLALHESLKTDPSEVASHQQTTADMMRWTQSVEDDICSNLAHELRNHIMNAKGDWEIPRFVVGLDEQGQRIIEDVPPLLNEFGIVRVVNMARPFLTRNMFNSNFSEEQINVTLKHTIIELYYDLIDHREDYGLGYAPDITTLGSIIRVFINYCKPGPFRALNDGERRLLRETTKNVHAQVSNDKDQNKQGLLRRTVQW